MLNENKVKMMTKMAIFEKNNKRDLQLHIKYFKSDYVTLGILKSIIAATFAYVLLAAAYVLLKMEDVISNINNLDYAAIGSKAVLYYVIFIVVYAIISFFVYAIKYEKAKDDVNKYNTRLLRLERFYNSRKK